MQRNKKNYHKKKKYIEVKQRYRDAQKMIKDQLWKFKNIKIEIEHYVFNSIGGRKV